MYHPEANGYTWLGNIDTSKGNNSYDAYKGQVNTLRLGEQAFDIHGNKLPSNYRPLFVKAGYDYDLYYKLLAVDTRKVCASYRR